MIFYITEGTFSGYLLHNALRAVYLGGLVKPETSALKTNRAIKMDSPFGFFYCPVVYFFGKTNLAILWVLILPCS